MDKDEPINVEGVRKDEKSVNKAGKSGDKVVDALKEMFDERTKRKGR
jgi:hypothetical protein